MQALTGDVYFLSSFNSAARVEIPRSEFPLQSSVALSGSLMLCGGKLSEFVEIVEENLKLLGCVSLFHHHEEGRKFIAPSKAWERGNPVSG